MHDYSAWLAFTAMQHRRYCGLPKPPHFPTVAGEPALRNAGPARKMEWVMSDENTNTFGSTALTWAMIAGAALLFFEITLSSAQPAAERSATVQTVTVARADLPAHN
jgi:hypothetical protein